MLNAIRYLLCLSLLVMLASLSSMAQTAKDTAYYVEVDSVELRYGRDLCDTLPELADSIFAALKTKKFESLKPYLPTAEMLQEEFDSMDLKRLQRLATVKQQYWEQNLRKQHIRLLKDTKVMRINLRHMELVKRRIKMKELDSGVRVGEITYLCQSGKHKFYLTFLAMEVVGKWFIGDELSVMAV